MSEARALETVPRLDWLDGLRAIAIAGVVLVHTAGLVDHASPLLRYFAGIGQYGVQLFFVISTITIMLTLSKEPRLSDWYTKRFFRIAPLYYLAIAVYHPVFQIEHALGERGPQGLSLLDILANVLFVHGWVPTAINSTVPGGWSIAVEMTFYLLAPLVAIYLRGVSPARGLLVTLGLGVALLFLSLLLSGGGPGNNKFMYFWPINQMPIFFFGMGLFVFFRSGVFDEAARPRLWTLLLGLVVLLAGFWLGVWGDVNHAVAPILVALGCWAMIVGAGSWKHVLSWPPLVFVGRISFSIYIVHFFFVDLFHFIGSRLGLPHDGLGGFAWLTLWMVVIFSLSMVAATASYHIVERPSVRLGARLIAWRARRRSMA